jgi:4-aminobutyrate aminotransferase-like enzyme
MIPASVTRYLERTATLHARYRAGQIHARTPRGLTEANRPIDDLVAIHLPISHEALNGARNALFYSLPVAFDPAEAIGPYLATADRDEHGEPFRFLDMGALIATQALGENDPAIVEAVLAELPVAVNRYAHSEYQTSVSLRMKAALDRIAPPGVMRHFVVNTGAEAVENAIKAVLLSRVRRTGEKDGGFIISFEGAYHGRTLGSLAVTHRKRARLGFPTFDWPQAPWPTVDRDDGLTRTREERSLRRIWNLLTVGRHSPRGAKASDQQFLAELDRIDGFLAGAGSLEAFAAEERARLPAETLRRALRCAAVLAEPIQGEGGIRLASGRFFRRLRVLTRVYDVPLLCDEIQTGFGATGRMWAHQHFDLPAPPDVVTWAKKAQNGVLFVSEELATFFQEEKKFNTTWEGDGVGMVRLLATIDRIHLEDVERTGALCRAGLERLAGDFPELVSNVRGLGVMLGFDVARSDWRDVLRDRAFRRGLLMMAAGERALRVYPRYDTEPYAIEEAMAILRAAIEDVLTGDTVAALGPRVRVGAPCDVPMETIEAVDLAGEGLAALRAAIMSVEIERYGGVAQYPADVLKAGARPLLQYPVEALESTMHYPRAIGIALRDPVSAKVIAYALGSPLENYDEEGVSLDPLHGEGATFYLQAMATLPSVKNQRQVENHLLDLVRERAVAQGFDHLSTLIEDETRVAGPPWLARGRVLKVVDNYLRSGVRFVYVQTRISSHASTETSTDAGAVDLGQGGAA